MMKLKGILAGIIVLSLIAMPLSGCQSKPKVTKIGVSFGVGAASRWASEQVFMEKRAAELGAEIEVRLNRTDEPKTQQQDCFELIDSGIDVLILTARDVTKVSDILDYAAEKKVPVINYARIVLGEPVELFVGCDSTRIGQRMGQYLAETVYEGDYILLRGSDGDNNATLSYNGAMSFIEPIRDDINIILDAAVPNWSPDEAKAMVMEAVKANGNHVDAILAPNDRIAGACVEALAELGVKDEVVITGMDADLDAAKRIVAGTQACTIYMDLEELATTAINEAVNIANGAKLNVNAEFDNQSGTPIKSNLISGRLVIKANLDKVLIDSGYYTRAEVYGE